MDDETKQHLDAMEARIKQDVKQEIKQEIDAAETRIKQEIKQELDAAETRIKQEMKTEMTTMKEQLIEAMRDMQTENLRAFADYHVSWDSRFTRIEASDATYAARLAALENRVFRLENPEAHK
jgi:hypothetical protein